MLEVPEEVARWFGLADVTVGELMEELRSDGWDGPLPVPVCGGALAVRVFIMGWSWAVYLAQTCLEAVVGSVKDVNLDSSRQLILGCRTPQFSIPKEFLTVHWLYVDDFGIISLYHPLIPNTMGLAIKLRNKIKARLAELRLGCHKEEQGGSVTAVGVLVGHNVWGVGPVESRRIMARQVTRHVVSLKIVMFSWIEALLGIWSWMALPARPSFSVFLQIYAFLTQCRGQSEVTLTPIVKRELIAISNLSCLLYAEMDADWFPWLWMTDASSTGGALVRYSASIDQLQEGAQWALSSVWQVVGQGKEGLPEALSLAAPHSVKSVSAFSGEYVTSVPKSIKIRLIRFLHLFSGHRREQDLCWYMEQWSVSSEALIIVDCIDLEASPHVDALDN